MDKNSPQSPRKRPYDAYIKYSGLGFQMLVILLLGVWGGIKLDQRLETDPLFTVILSVFAFIAALYVVIKEVIRSS